MEPSGSLQEGSGEHRVGALGSFFCMHQSASERCVFSKKGWLIINYQFSCYGWRNVYIFKQNNTSGRIRKGINTHTSFLPDEISNTTTKKHQDEIHHLNQQPKNGVPPQSLTWNLENDGCQVRWKSPFSQVGHFSGEPCTPDGRFNGERNRNRHHYPLFRKEFHDHLKFKPPGFIRVHSPTNFANMYPKTQKISIFSSILKISFAVRMHEETPAAIRGFWRPSRWDGNWSCLADEGVFRPRRFFWGGKMETYKNWWKIGRYLVFETWKSSFSDFEHVFFGLEISYMKQATCAFVCLRFWSFLPQGLR